MILGAAMPGVTKFCDLMTISLLCALCGGETAVDMKLFGQRRRKISCARFSNCPTAMPAMRRIPAYFA
jgi:hypothetical protein